MPERTLGTRALLWVAHVAVRATLTVSPVVVVAISRKVYAAGGDRIRRALDKHAPDGVVVLTDERYGDDADIFNPRTTSDRVAVLRCGSASVLRQERKRLMVRKGPDTP